jgi:hypothetical protein
MKYAKLKLGLVFAVSIVAAANLYAQEKYDKVYEYHEGLALVKKKTGIKSESGFDEVKYGFIDENENEVIPLVYDYATNFQEGLASVKKDGKEGFIDKNGNIIIQVRYNLAKSFTEGMAAVMLQQKWGFVDREGNETVALQYDFAGNFSEGMAAVKKDGKYGFIDKNGNVIIPFKYDNARGFSEGMAAVMLKQKWGYVDSKGNEIVKPKYNSVENFKNGLAMVDNNTSKKLSTGTALVATTRDVVGREKSRKVVAFYNNMKYISKEGVIDITGKVIIPLKYSIKRQEDDTFTVCKKENENCAVYDKNGKEVK